MSHAALIDIFASVAGFGLAIRILAPRELHAAGLVLLAIGWAGLLADVAPSSISSHPARIIAAGVIGVAIAAALARWFVAGRPLLLVAVTTLVLPLHVPIVLGGSTRNLLVPLYGVLGVWLLLDLGRSAQLMQHAPPLRVVWARSRDQLGRQLRGAASGAQLIDIAVASYALWSCLSLAWTFDRTTGEVDSALFVVPFALLYALARDMLRGGQGVDLWRVLRVATWSLLTVMGVAAVAGIYQHVTGTIWENPKVRIADIFAPDFRTNSLFWDPNIYGRYLVAGILAAISLLVWTPLRSVQRTGLAIWLAISLLALWWSYSQSSFIALSIGCVVLALLALRPRAALFTTLAVLVVIGGLFPIAKHEGVFDNQDRIDVAEGGLSLMSQSPMRGFGVGSFDRAYASFEGDRGNLHLRLRASHATPVTVGAELGFIGLSAYLALLIGAAIASSEGRARTGRLAAARSDSERAPSIDSTNEDTVKASFGLSATEFDADHGMPDLARWSGAVFAAVVAHSMLYAGFFEDPLVWACAAGLAAAPLARASGPADSDPTPAAPTTRRRANAPSTPA